MPKPVVIIPDQQLKAPQNAQNKGGEKKGYLHTGTAAKLAKVPLRKTGKDIMAEILAKKAQPTPYIAKQAPLPASVPAEFADKLIELETARLKKNGWSREFERIEAEVKEAFEHMDKPKFTCDLLAKGADDKDQKVTITIEKQEGGTVEVETLDKIALRSLVSPTTYDQCTVIQKGLVKTYAGEATLARITTTEIVPVEGVIVTIKSKKDKAILA